MSDRLVTPAYYEQQQRLQHQQQQLPPMMASNMLTANKQQQQQQASAEMSLHYQRLQEYNASTGRTVYDNRSGYHSSGGYSMSQAYGSSYGSSGSHYGHIGGSYFHPYFGSGGNGSHYESSLAARQRYAPYPHHHHQQNAHHHHSHSGMFTPAGQQLVPSSVLHYPPRNTPYQQQQQQQQQHSGYDQPTPMPYSSSRSLPYAQTPYGIYNSVTHLPYQQQQLAASVPNRSSTPAPNRTVVPHYLEPLHLTRKTTSAESAGSPNFNAVACGSGTTGGASYASNASLPNDKSPPPQPPEGESTNVHSPATNDHSARLTTSPPLISATGTDSGISNCSTRARSDSSQSTPIYSSEYPVSMSVESSSCVSYHCGTDEAERETSARSTSPLEMKVKRELESAGNDEEDQTSTLVKHEPSNDDISQSTATATAASNGDKTKPGTATEKHQSHSQSNDEDNNKEGHGVNADNEDENESNLPPPPSDAKREIKLLTQTTSTILPEDTAVDCKSRRVAGVTNEVKSASKLPSLSPIGRKPTEMFNASSNWIPFGSYSPTLCTPRRQRTPPVPHNSPVGYGSCSGIPMPSLTPLLRVKSTVPSGATIHKSTTPRTTIATNKSRIIECDLIPSKKSKRKSLQRAKGTSAINSSDGSNGLINSGSSDGSPELQQESPVREEIRDIKPLPGFQQAFGSTEIGRFSETFLLTPENSLENDALQYEEYEQLQAHHHHHHLLQQQNHSHLQQQPQQQQSPHYHQNGSFGYYETTSYEPPRSCDWANYEAFHDYNRRAANHQSRYGSSYQHYMAYERFMGVADGGGAAGAGYSRRGPHARFGEIRCNGY